MYLGIIIYMQYKSYKTAGLSTFLTYKCKSWKEPVNNFQWSKYRKVVKFINNTENWLKNINSSSPININTLYINTFQKIHCIITGGTCHIILTTKPTFPLMVILVVYPLNHSSATLNSPEHSSSTAPSLGKLSSRLSVQDAYTFARNCYSYFCTC